MCDNLLLRIVQNLFVLHPTCVCACVYYIFALSLTHYTQMMLLGTSRLRLV